MACQSCHLYALERIVVQKRMARTEDKVSNPFTASGPVPAHGPFYGRREEMAELRRLIEDPTTRVVHVTGARRVGKSSLLRRLALQLREPLRSMYLNPEGMADIPFALALRELSGAILHPGKGNAFRPRLVTDIDQTVRRMVDALRKAAGGRRVLLLVDELDVPASPAGPESTAARFYPFLERLLADVPGLTLVLATGRRRDAHAPHRSMSALLDAPRCRIGHFDRDTAEAFLTEVGRCCFRFHPLALRTAVDLAGGHPYLLQEIGATLVEFPRRRPDKPIGLLELMAALSGLLKRAEEGLAWMWAGLEHDEQVVARAVAVNGSSDHPVSIPSLQEWMRIHTPEMERARLARTLDNLLELEWIARTPGGDVAIRPDLVRRWLLQNASRLEAAAAKEAGPAAHSKAKEDIYIDPEVPLRGLSQRLSKVKLETDGLWDSLDAMLAAGDASTEEKGDKGGKEPLAVPSGDDSRIGGSGNAGREPNGVDAGVQGGDREGPEDVGGGRTAPPSAPEPSVTAGNVMDASESEAPPTSVEAGDGDRVGGQVADDVDPDLLEMTDDEAAAKDDDELSSLIVEGMEAMRRGDPHGAQGFFQAALESDPHSEAARAGYCRSLVAQQRFQHALESVEALGDDSAEFRDDLICEVFESWLVSEEVDSPAWHEVVTKLSTLVPDHPRGAALLLEARLSRVEYLLEKGRPVDAAVALGSLGVVEQRAIEPMLNRMTRELDALVEAGNPEAAALFAVLRQLHAEPSAIWERYIVASVQQAEHMELRAPESAARRFQELWTLINNAGGREYLSTQLHKRIEKGLERASLRRLEAEKEKVRALRESMDPAAFEEELERMLSQSSSAYLEKELRDVRYRRERLSQFAAIRAEIDRGHLEQAQRLAAALAAVDDTFVDDDGCSVFDLLDQISLKKIEMKRGPSSKGMGAPSPRGGRGRMPPPKDDDRPRPLPFNIPEEDEEDVVPSRTSAARLQSADSVRPPNGEVGSVSLEVRQPTLSRSVESSVVNSQGFEASGEEESRASGVSIFSSPAFAVGMAALFSALVVGGIWIGVRQLSKLESSMGQQRVDGSEVAQALEIPAWMNDSNVAADPFAVDSLAAVDLEPDSAPGKSSIDEVADTDNGVLGWGAGSVADESEVPEPSRNAPGRDDMEPLAHYVSSQAFVGPPKPVRHERPLEQPSAQTFQKGKSTARKDSSSGGEAKVAPWMVTSVGSRREGGEDESVKAMGESGGDVEPARRLPLRSSDARRNRSPRERTALSRGRGIDPTDPLELGRRAARAGRLDEAYAAFHQALLHSPDRPEVHLEIGKLALLQGRTDDAVEAFERATELNPRLVSAHYALGKLYQSRGKVGEALDEFKAVLAEGGSGPMKADAERRIEQIGKKLSGR